MITYQEEYDKFNPANLQVKKGVYDFTKAHNYDEELVKYNLNRVKRANDIEVIAPNLSQEKKVE